MQMQPDLFAAPAMSAPAPPPVVAGEALAAPDGRGRRDTSRMAFAEQRDAGKLANNQARIVALLKANLGRDYTRSEIGEATGMPINVVAGRTNELIHVKCLLEEKRKRACAVTGKTVWAVGLR